jgi:hypothetical protein
VRSALRDNNLAVVGHTADYRPFCSPFESLRRAAVGELKICLEVFAGTGLGHNPISPGLALNSQPIECTDWIGRVLQLRRPSRGVHRPAFQGREVALDEWGVPIEGFTVGREISTCLETEIQSSKQESRKR